MSFASSSTTNGQDSRFLNKLVKTNIAITRFDPVYSDAKARAATLGEFNFFNAWMSQPKNQLETFRAWAGKDSDIRYATLAQEFVHTQEMPDCVVITSPPTTSISARGSCKILLILHASLRVQPPVLQQVSHTIVSLRLRTRLHSWSTGNLSKAPNTRELVYIQPVGPHL